jgi:hypothetical protein
MLTKLRKKTVKKLLQDRFYCRGSKNVCVRDVQLDVPHAFM